MTRRAFSEKDKGYRRILRATADLGGKAVAVGIHDGEVAEYGAYNEFGTTQDGKVHTPERSFLRASFDENEAKLRRASVRLWGGVIDGKLTVDQGLGLLGEMHQGQVQAKIASHPPPPNAPATIARKRSSGTLVDSGRLRQSIRWVIEKTSNEGFFRRLIRRLYPRGS